MPLADLVALLFAQRRLPKPLDIVLLEKKATLADQLVEQTNAVSGHEGRESRSQPLGACSAERATFRFGLVRYLLGTFNFVF